MRHIYGIDGFSNGSDLVYLYQQGIGRFFINTFLQAFYIRYKQIVAYPLARAYASWFAGQSKEHPTMSENTTVRAPRHRAERVGAGQAEGTS